jgi:hypothetical protein
MIRYVESELHTLRLQHSSTIHKVSQHTQQREELKDQQQRVVAPLLKQLQGSILSTDRSPQLQSPVLQRVVCFRMLNFSIAMQSSELTMWSPLLLPLPLPPPLLPLWDQSQDII